MKKFKKLTAPQELDFFQIFENEDGVKHIHILGYCYERDDDWGNVEATFIIVPLSEFVEKYKKGDRDYTDLLYQEANQYQEDISAEKMTEIINTYFNGQPADYYLDFSGITEDTPCGNYVFPYALTEYLV